MIDADAFKEYIQGACDEMSHMYKDGGKLAKQITDSFCMDIDEQPTVDAVEVIHCGHCRHHENDSSSDSHWCFVWETFTDNHVYCSFAERREDGKGM